MNFPSKLVENAVEQLSSLPGIGKKSALRLVLYLLKKDKLSVEKFGDAFIDLINNINYCSSCYSISTSNLCEICANPKRNSDIIGDLYAKYDSELKNSLLKLSQKINSLHDLKENLNQYEKLEREITIKHSKIVLEISKKFNIQPNIIGFHGQTILHKPEKGYSIQMGNAELLSQLVGIR